MRDMLIENRLWEWARWWITVEAGADGYPKQSMIQMFRDGVGFGGEFGARPLCSNPRAQETDILIKRLASENKPHAETIQAFYLLKKNIYAKAQVLGISKRTFYRRLDAAKQWLINKIEF